MKYWYLIVLFILFLAASSIGSYFYLLRNIPIQKSVTNSEPVAKDTVSSSQFSTELPPSESFSGTIATMSGQIDITTRTATAPAALVSPVPLYQGERIQTKDDGMITVTFPDAKMTAILDTNSDISIVQTLPQSIVVEQHAGIINYQKQSTVPSGLRIFHLLLQADAEASLSASIDPDTFFTTIVLKSGKVKAAFNSRSYVTQTQMLSDGETWIYDDTKRTIVEQ